VDLDVNVKKTKYMLVSRDQNAGQNRGIRVANTSFANVSQFKYLAAKVTNQNLIQEEIKWRSNSGNSCYHSIQKRLSSRLVSKGLVIKIYENICEI
jgi:hypothetical protein